MTRKNLELIQLEALKQFIIPLDEMEYKQLEENIISEGCLEALTIWEAKEGLVLVDGHNRFRICREHDIKFKIRRKQFKDLIEVQRWMINNQLGRRNLGPDQLSYYRGIKYLDMKKKKGGYSYIESKGQSELSTSKLLADLYKTSESTIKRDSQFALGLNLIGQKNPKLKKQILSSQVKANKADVILIAKLAGKGVSITNTRDLAHKASVLRKQLNKDMKINQQNDMKKRLESAQAFLRKQEPLFQKRTARLQKLKASFVSAINRGIAENDLKVIEELQELTKELARELASNK